MVSRRVLQVALGVLLGLGAVGLAATLSGGSDPAPTTDPHVLPSPYAAGALGLRAQTGERVEVEDLVHPLTVVFFGYTHCPDVCPLTLAHLSRAAELLGDVGGAVGGVMVSVDPARDTPERLATYLGPFRPGFLGLTGTEDEVDRVAAAWGVYRAVPEEGRSAHGYEVDHSARAFVVQRDSIVASFPPYTSAEAMAATLRRLLERR